LVRKSRLFALLMDRRGCGLPIPLRARAQTKILDPKIVHANGTQLLHNVLVRASSIVVVGGLDRREEERAK
jgi:hypothetical protein